MLSTSTTDTRNSGCNLFDSARPLEDLARSKDDVNTAFHQFLNVLEQRGITVDQSRRLNGVGSSSSSSGITAQ